MTEPRLTLHDSILINLAAASLIGGARPPEMLVRDLGMIREVLGRVTRDTIRVRDLADACEAMLLAHEKLRAAPPGSFVPEWHRAVYDAQLALEKIFEWRAAAALARAEPQAAPAP